MTTKEITQLVSNDVAAATNSESKDDSHAGRKVSSK
jgi:hypothetical protein